MIKLKELVPIMGHLPNQIVISQNQGKPIGYQTLKAHDKQLDNCEVVKVEVVIGFKELTDQDIEVGGNMPRWADPEVTFPQGAVYPEHCVLIVIKAPEVI